MLFLKKYNFKASFKEARFVFEVDPPDPEFDSEMRAMAQKRLEEVEAAKAQAGVKVEVGKAEVAEKTGHKIADAKSKVQIAQNTSFEDLKGGLEGIAAFRVFFESMNLRGFEIGSLVDSGDLDFASEGNKNFILKKFEDELARKDLSGLEGMIDAQGGDLGGALANIYANKTVAALNVEFAKIRTYYDEFVEKPENAGVEVRYKVVVSGGIPRCSFSGGGTFNAGLTEYNKKKAGNSPDSAEEAQATTEAEIESQAAKLAATPIGRILAMFAPKNKDGKPDLTGVIRGDDFVGVFICGLFGYTDYVGESYAGLVEMLPAKYKEKIEKWEKRARASKLSADYAKKGVSGSELETTAGVIQTPLFETYISTGDDLPKEGVKIGSEYPLGTEGNPKTMVVYIEDDGVIALPKGVAANVNGQLSTKGQVFDKSFEKIAFTGPIPKGTAFRGKVRFELAKGDEEKLRAAQGGTKTPPVSPS